VAALFDAGHDFCAPFAERPEQRQAKQLEPRGETVFALEAGGALEPERLAREYPAIKPSVRTLAAESIARAVASGRADVGLLAGAPRSSLRGLSVRLLFEEPLVALMRRTDPLARSKRLRLAQLAERELLLVPDGTFLSDIVHEACARAAFTPNVRLTLASAEALRETVRAGLGLTILPRGYASPADRDLVAVPLTRPTPTREVLLVERGPKLLATPRAVTAFAAVLTRRG
jgi:DNA-binding transcriptional LysR family regulator